MNLSYKYNDSQYIYRLLVMLQDLLDFADVSFKWILLTFNFLTIIFVYIHKLRNKKSKQHHILFVTAHPDDQCMFFRPTIVGLQGTYFIHLLCLSGQGTARQEQLKQASKALQIDHVHCINDPKLFDGMKQKWCEETIRKYVLQYIKNNNIKAVFTFDHKGVSNHINHTAINFALRQLQTKSNNQGAIKIYYLESVCLPRKYSGILQIFIAIIKTYSWIDFCPFAAFSNMSNHASQFLWFRKLWVFFSRYQYINTYQRALIKINTQNHENTSNM